MPIDEPAFTVAIPTVGRWSSLRACVASIASEWPSHAQGPLIVLASEDLRLPPDLDAATVVARPGSVGAARNAAMRAATTDWVVFLDDDCLAPPGWLVQIGTRLAQWTAAGVGVAGGVVADAPRRGRLYRFTRELNYMRTAGTMKRRANGLPSLGGANLALSRECWQAISGFDESLASTEDYDLLVRARRGGWGIGTYFDLAPVIHAHETSWATFVRRHHGYGRGVAQTVRRNTLDPNAHRVYVSKSPFSIGPAALRFAKEDLVWMRDRGRPPGPSAFLFAMLRGLAWQAGAWCES